VPGYEHRFEHSKFSIGETRRHKRQNRFDRIEGTNGVFAVHLRNGSVLAIPNADAPSLRVSRFGPTAQEHNAWVLQYFSAAGLPRDQTEGVHAASMIDITGSMDKRQAQMQLVAYYSILERAVDGIPVVDSFAWARVNADGEVVSEAVYWPSIPNHVLAEAKRLRNLIEDPDSRATYESRLGTGHSGGDVVIRHASAEVNTDFEALASYDVTVRSGTDSSFTRHFDVNGTERRLPQERFSVSRSSAGQNPPVRP
jgi:hypothetical protein